MAQKPGQGGYQFAHPHTVTKAVYGVKAGRIRPEDSDTVRKTLVMDSDADSSDSSVSSSRSRPAQRKRGRPAKTTKRPEVLRQFRSQGFLTPEGAGYMRAFIELTWNLFSWRDWEAMFRIPQPTIRRHMKKHVGWSTQELEKKKAPRRDPEVTTDRHDAVMKLIHDNHRFSTLAFDEEPVPLQQHSWCATCHVWGAIGRNFRVVVNLTQYHSGKRGGVNSEDYCDMLEHFFLRKWRRIVRRHPQAVFHQDGARIHYSQETLAKLEEWGIRHLAKNEWPPRSPDFNPIENMWGVTKRALSDTLYGDLSNSEANIKHLWNAVETFFNDQDEQYINTLVASFRHRLQRAIELKGAYTGY